MPLSPARQQGPCPWAWQMSLAPFVSQVQRAMEELLPQLDGSEACALPSGAHCSLVLFCVLLLVHLVTDIVLICLLTVADDMVSENNLGEERVYFSLHFQGFILGGNEGVNLRQKP